MPGLRSALMRTATFAHLPGFGAAAARRRARTPTRRAEDNADGDPQEVGNENEATSGGEGDPAAPPDEDEAPPPAPPNSRRARRRRARSQEPDEGNEDGDDGRVEDPDGDDEGGDAGDGDDADDGDEGDDEGDDESDGQEMRARGTRGRRSRAARAHERGRCKAIFASPHAAANVQLAAHFAFNTTMTRGQAIAALKAAIGNGGGQTSLSARMAGHQVPPIGTGGGERRAPRGVDRLASALIRARNDI
ncbi:MAG: hypothetical protein HIU82_02180 [Proteobacteria bacterium]|nr:hypothetical protein [Pseudomonadota bacterium]